MPLRDHDEALRVNWCEITFKHNYGHGQQHLSALLATLILLSYLLHAIGAHGQPIPTAGPKLPSRRPSFDDMRALTTYLCFDSWGQFGPQRQRAQQKFSDFVRAGIGLPSVWGGLRRQIFLGGDKFIARLQAEIAADQPLDEVPRLQRRPAAKPLASYRKEHGGNPHLGMALAYLSGDYTMKAVAEEFGVHYTTVSRAVKEFESRRTR